MVKIMIEVRNEFYTIDDYNNTKHMNSLHSKVPEKK